MNVRALFGEDRPPLSLNVPFAAIPFNQADVRASIADALAFSPTINPGPDVDRSRLRQRNYEELTWLVSAAVGSKLMFTLDGECKRGGGGEVRR